MGTSVIAYRQQDARVPWYCMYLSTWKSYKNQSYDTWYHLLTLLRVNAKRHSSEIRWPAIFTLISSYEYKTPLSGSNRIYYSGLRPSVLVDPRLDPSL